MPQKHREFPILVEKLEWNIKENCFFVFFFFTRDYTEIYLKVQSIQYRYLGDMFHWWETNLVLHIIRTTMMFKLFHMQPNKKTQFRPATQAVQELCFQGCAVVEVTAPSWQEV